MFSKGDSVVWRMRMGVPVSALQMPAVQPGQVPACPELQCFYQQNENKHSMYLIGLF